jgi:hypothetical protein
MRRVLSAERYLSPERYFLIKLSRPE